MGWRRRLVPLSACSMVLVVGLAVDRTGTGAVADKAGDVLYAALVVLGLWLLRPGARVLALAGAALAWCVAVELLQLTDVPRAVATVVPAARLVLGSGFDPLDLPAYALGCLLGAAVVVLARRARTPSPPASGHR